MNWGLGHASRSIPLIRKLSAEGHKLFLASDGNAGMMLQNEFPDLTYFELPSYDINYKFESIVLNLLKQRKKFQDAIKKEHQALHNLVKTNKIDQVISDNRFGCYHEQCKNIFITHQIKLLHKNPIIELIGTKINRKFISKFTECWIPDYESKDNLSGILSHGISLNIPIKFIGPLSRFQKLDKNSDSKFTFLCILSGPEPQRTIFENLLRTQLENIEGQHVIVSGTPRKIEKKKNISYYGIMNHNEITDLILQSKKIISRSGYSSIMDYYAMDISAFLVPTPGQSEQEYLGRLHSERKKFQCVSQKKFDLSEMILE